MREHLTQLKRTISSLLQVLIRLIHFLGGPDFEQPYLLAALFNGVDDNIDECYET